MSASELAPLTEGMLPKDPKFAAKYPKYDGRGVTVAIFDTGCDHGAPGLIHNPDGSMKFLDYVDSTGSGDVDMSLKVTATTPNEITGLSGRTLKLNPAWSNPTGVFRVGLKPMYDLFPGPLVSRLKTARANAHNKAQAAVEADLLRDIAAATDADAKADLESRLKSLKALYSAPDVGPVVDCVSFHDGTYWRACIDTTGSGDLTSCEAMAAYKHEFGYACFSQETQLNYSFNFYEDGDVLSIVVAAGSHGTHVAGIVGAYFPGDVARSGNAPGCNMISVKIGDSALGTMETGPGLLRGVIAAAEAGCDLVNMSYGEQTSSPNFGRFVEYAQSLVRKHGMMFVTSAGNAGPCLTTVGSPGGNEYMIGVGAFVLPSMPATQYGLAGGIPHPGRNYQWSSRGPVADGALGVSISACGGAYAPVPNWTLSHSQQMNGTSMSSPAACGLISCLVSGLKQKGLKYSPARVKATIEATARRVATAAPTALGAGVLDVLAAFESLVAEASEPALDYFYKVRVSNMTHPSHHNTLPARGIYVREVGQAARAMTYSVAVQPEFPEWLDETEGVTPGQQSKGPKPYLPSFTSEDKVNTLMYVTLESDDTTGAVTTAPYLVLTHTGARFQVHVDGSKLAPGLHFSNITGRLASHPDAARAGEEAAAPASRSDVPALFTIPVTICVPEPDQPLSNPALCAGAASAAKSAAVTAAVVASAGVGASRYRYPAAVLEHTKIFTKFFPVPVSATWAQVTLRAVDVDDAYRYFLQGRQVIPQQPDPPASTDKVIMLRQGQEHTFIAPVIGGVTWELCLAPEWAAVKPLTVDMTVEFFGVSINGINNTLTKGNALAATTAHPALPLTVSIPAPLPPLTVTLAAKYSRLERSFFPTAVALAPLSARDTFPGAKGTYELTLTYALSFAADVTVVARVPVLNGVLYEAPFDSQMVRVFNSDNKLVFTGDAWPSARFNATTGAAYTAIVSVRHESVSALKALSGTPLVADIALSSPVKASAYLTRAECVAGGDGNATYPHLTACAAATAFLAPPAKLPTFALPGDVLTGVVTVVPKTCKAAQSTLSAPAPEDVGAVPVFLTVARAGSATGADVVTKACGKLVDCAAARAIVGAKAPTPAASPSAAAATGADKKPDDAPAAAATAAAAAAAEGDDDKDERSVTVAASYVSSLAPTDKASHAWALRTILAPLRARSCFAANIPLNKALLTATAAAAASPADEYAAIKPIVDAFINAVDLGALALHFGSVTAAADMTAAEKAEHATKDAQRSAVSYSFAALTRAAVAADAAAATEESLAAVKSELSRLNKWVAAADTPVKAAAALYVAAREGKIGTVAEAAATGTAEKYNPAVMRCVYGVVTADAGDSGYNAAAAAATEGMSAGRVLAVIAAAAAKKMGWEDLAEMLSRKAFVDYPLVKDRFF